MQRSTIQWLLFASLALTAPAMLFMVQAVIFMPAVFILGGLLAMLPKLATATSLSENLSFAGFFLFHLLVFGCLYGLISWLLAKLICLIKKPGGRILPTLILVIAFTSLAFFPIYGSGGHGPMRWTTLAGLCADFDRSYNFPVTLLVYGSSAGCGLLLYGIRYWRKRLQNQQSDAML